MIVASLQIIKPKVAMRALGFEAKKGEVVKVRGRGAGGVCDFTVSIRLKTFPKLIHEYDREETGGICWADFLEISGLPAHRPVAAL